MPAEGFYDALSLYIHPQSFPSRPEAIYNSEAGDSHLETDVASLAKVSMGALACWIDATRVLYDYHGYRVPELDEIADAADALTPSRDVPERE